MITQEKIPYCNLNCLTLAFALPLVDTGEHYTIYHKWSVTDVTDFAGKKANAQQKHMLCFLDTSVKFILIQIKKNVQNKE